MKGSLSESDRIKAAVGKSKTNDPSLTVAHSDYGAFAGRDLFRELHPEAAKKWDGAQWKKKCAKFVNRDSRELEF